MLALILIEGLSITECFLINDLIECSQHSAWQVVGVQLMTMTLSHRETYFPTQGIPIYDPKVLGISSPGIYAHTCESSLFDMHTACYFSGLS